MNTFTSSTNEQVEEHSPQQSPDTPQGGDKSLHSFVDPDTSLIASLKKSSDFQKVVFFATDEQYALLSLFAISSSFAPHVTLQPTLKLKTGNSVNICSIAKAVGRLCSSPYLTDSLQGADINKYCLSHEYATVVTMYDSAHSKVGRNTRGEIKLGHHLIVHATTLPYKHSEDDLLGSIHLPDAEEGQTFTDAEKLSEVQEAELTLLQAELNFWLIKNKHTVLEKMKHCLLPQPEGLPDKLFEVWKPILVLASLTTVEYLQAVYTLMKESNPYKNQLTEEIALLLDIKVISEHMQQRYIKETAIASATLIGELKALAHEQWKDLHPKSLAQYMSKFGMSTEQIKYHHIGTTGYALDALQIAFNANLDIINKPLQEKRYKETLDTVNLKLAS